MKTKPFHYQDGQTTCQGYLAFPENKKSAPIVLVAPDWRGRTEFADKKAEMLAAMGYIGFAMDVYGEGKTGSSVEENTKLITPFMQDREFLKKRLQAAYEGVKQVENADQHNVAIMGYCFGGLCALDLARTGINIKGSVSFHGLLEAPKYKTPEKINAKILVLHGYDDPLAQPNQVIAFADEMTKAKADWQIVMYGHVKHAFTNPLANDDAMGLIYNERAKNRSEIALKNFLNEVFQS